MPLPHDQPPSEPYDQGDEPLTRDEGPELHGVDDIADAALDAHSRPIVVSAYTASGTVIHDEMHHGSVINTLCRQHGLAPLTSRDQTANPVFNAVNLTTPRQPYTWPKPKALYVARNPEESPGAAASTHKNLPLTAPARGLMGLLLARFNPGGKAPTTYGEAFEAISTHGSDLFGTTDDNA